MPRKKIQRDIPAALGRNQKPIDWERFDHMLRAGCEGTQIAPIFNMHPDTLYKRVLDDKGICFTDYQSMKRAEGDGVLLTCQYDKASSGDNTMMVWLGKNRLKQRENPTELTVSNETVQSFKDIMNQVKSAQEARKIDDSNIINDAKS